MNDEVIICRCKELTVGELRREIERGATTLGELRRRTGAGMGMCQGKSCTELICRLLAEYGHAPDVPGSPRPPVRPVPIRDLFQQAEE